MTDYLGRFTGAIVSDSKWGLNIPERGYSRVDNCLWCQVIKPLIGDPVWIHLVNSLEHPVKAVTMIPYRLTVIQQRNFYE